MIEINKIGDTESLISKLKTTVIHANITRKALIEMYEDAISFKNLYKSMKKCCKNVRWKTSVIGYEWNGIKNTYLLRQSLLNGTYKIDKYAEFTIQEPKARKIQATRIKDRQLQRSLCDNGFIEQISKGFIYDNCACQEGKGILFAINRFDYHLHKYYRKNQTNNGYVLKCDVKNFFGSLDHNVCKSCVEKRIKDKDILMYIFDIIDSFKGDVGLGLGSQISQYIALAVLDDLDHFIKEKLRIKNYIRYMDDFILIHPDKEYLIFCKEQISEFLFNYRLELNDKTQIMPLKNGVIFLNWRYKLTETGKIIKIMNKKALKRKRRHIKKLIKSNVSIKTINDSFRSWNEYMKYGNTFKIRQNMLKYKERKLHNYVGNDRSHEIGEMRSNL